MADGSEWKKMRAWLVRSLRNLGFSRDEMSKKLNDELEIILDKLKLQNNKPLRIKPIIAPAIINGIWSLVTGKRIHEEKRYFLSYSITYNYFRMYYANVNEYFYFLETKF